MDNIKNINKINFYGSLLIYVVALFCPAYYVIGHINEELPIWGLECLLKGWVQLFVTLIILREHSSQPGLSFVLCSISWFANLFIMAAWYTGFRGKYIRAKVYSGIAVILSLLFVLAFAVPAWMFNISKLGIGYLLWVLSCLYFFIATIILNYNIKKDETKLADVG